MASKIFLELCDKMKEVHIKKNEDYAAGEWDENFKRAALIAEWFNDPMDKVFATLIGIKLARLAVLRNSNKPPNNESIEDTGMDMTIYSGMWTARITESNT